jgi:TatD DNase family protein
VTYLVDSHAHIQEPDFAAGLEDVIGRARAAGVGSIIVPAVDLDSARSALTLAQRYGGLYATAGYHPHEASRLDAEALAAVEALLSHPKVVAVGEIGLDYFRLHSTREEQLAAMQSMLALADAHTKPVIVHCRDAWQDTAALLEPWAARVRGRFGGRPVGVLHYFSGDVQQAERYAEAGFLISMHTSATHPRQAQMREVAAAMPLDMLLIETDSPYGAPQAYRGKRNEPAYVVEAARQIAHEKGVSLSEVAEATSANARRFFGIAADEAVASLAGAAS